MNELELQPHQLTRLKTRGRRKRRLGPVTMDYNVWQQIADINIDNIPVDNEQAFKRW